MATTDKSTKDDQIKKPAQAQPAPAGGEASRARAGAGAPAGSNAGQPAGSGAQGRGPAAGQPTQPRNGERSERSEGQRAAAPAAGSQPRQAPQRAEGGRPAAAGQGPAQGGPRREGQRSEPQRPDGTRRPAPAGAPGQPRPGGQQPGGPGRAPTPGHPSPSTARPGAGTGSGSPAANHAGGGSGSNSQPGGQGTNRQGSGGQVNRPGGQGMNRPGGGGQMNRPAGGQGPSRSGGGGQYRGSNGSHGHSHGGPRRPDQRSGGKGQGQAATAQTPEAAAAAGRAEAAAKAAVTVTEVVIPTLITVRELAEKMHKSPIEVIKALMNYGIMVPITQTIDFDTAVIVGEDLGIAVKGEAAPEPEVKEEPKEEVRTLRQRIMAEEDPNALVIRPPVVTVLGHVDHGKTTLLDAIRETRVVEGEAGGITQHIGAYQVERNGRKITFLDTPGHAAFTAMRARGASVTDIAVLVVAADDGVMPQTKEAIAHAKAAQVPILVALNKTDKPGANPDRVKQELADNGVLIEEYGGDVVCVPVSAKFRRGIEDILESILLVYDVEPAKANPGGECVGSVIESRLDKSRGPTATLLVQNGTLHTGDSIVLGDTYGKIRAMFDDKGEPINEAPPAFPAVVLGLADVPVAGDTFKVMADERTARNIAAERVAEKRAEANQPAPKALTLETIFAQVEAGQAKELNLILKADVQGSIEPIVNSLDKLSNDKVKVKILHEGTGNITESDVMLAVASKAIILGFSVTVQDTAQRTAEAEGVDIRNYNIIYNLVEDVEKALTGMLEPVYQEVVTGHAEIRQVFHVSKVGKVAGCMVIDGEIARNSAARVKRGGQVIKEDKVSNLKRFQEDAAEVKTGYECGINLANFNDFEVGDIIEAYKKERVS